MHEISFRIQMLRVKCCGAHECRVVQHNHYLIPLIVKSDLSVWGNELILKKGLEKYSSSILVLKANFSTTYHF